MQKKTLYARQGDCLIFRVENIDDEIKSNVTNLSEKDEVVFALGERTGHRHRVGGLKRGDRAFRRGTLETNPEHFISLRGTRRLVHDEHDPIDIPAGDYHVVIQRQYEAGAIRNVQD